VLGGRLVVNDIPSGDDLVQFGGGRGPWHGDSVRYGRT